jgi:hypothetical protein
MTYPQVILQCFDIQRLSLLHENACHRDIHDQAYKRTRHSPSPAARRAPAAAGRLPLRLRGPVCRDTHPRSPGRQGHSDEQEAVASPHGDYSGDYVATAGSQGLRSWSMRRAANADWPCFRAVDR